MSYVCMICLRKHKDIKYKVLWSLMSQTSAGAMFSRPGRAELSRLERPFRAPQRNRAGSSGLFGRPGGAERARVAISSAPAKPRGHFERPFRASRDSGPSSTGQFEPCGALGQARSRKCRQVRCSRARPSRVKFWSVQSAQAPLRKF